MYNDSSFAEGYAIGRDSNNNNGYNNGMFGGDWSWFLIILLIFGWGGFGNGFGNNGGFMNGALTRGELCQDMNFNDLQSAVRGISNGICDSTFALNNTMTNGFANVQQTLCQCCNGINTSILTSSNETQRGITDLGFRLQDCCCQLSRGQERIICENATNTANIIQAGNANTQRILDYLCNEKISALQAENSLLTAQLSQNAQTSNIINTLTDRLQPVAKPAYLTCSPYESSYGFGYGRNGYGNNSCGCGCGCN